MWLPTRAAANDCCCCRDLSSCLDRAKQAERRNGGTPTGAGPKQPSGGNDLANSSAPLSCRRIFAAHAGGPSAGRTDATPGFHPSPLSLELGAAAYVRAAHTDCRAQLADGYRAKVIGLTVRGYYPKDKEMVGTGSCTFRAGRVPTPGPKSRDRLPNRLCTTIGTFRRRRRTRELSGQKREAPFPGLPSRGAEIRTRDL